MGHSYFQTSILQNTLLAHVKNSSLCRAEHKKIARHRLRYIYLGWIYPVII